MNEMVAVVVLHPASGPLSGDDLITAGTIEDFLPAPGDLDRAVEWFRSAGFVVEAGGPISFSIAAEPELFVSVFGDVTGPSFDIGAIPASIRGLLAAVETMEPPDFGPGQP